METRPLVSIIIINFNTPELTLACIESLKKYVKVAYEIIVVDNASKDDSVAKLKSKTDKFIRNKENIGFAAANNQGIKVARGEYFLLLNSDTYLTEDAISKATEFLSIHDEYGIISCSLRNKDGSRQATGGYFPTIGRLVLWMSFIDDIPLVRNILTSAHPHLAFYETSRELDWVTGAFFMIRREVIKKAGNLDEDYFMYVEELDFCFRARKEGFKVFYLADTSIIHLGQASSTNEFALTSEYKNLVLFYKKHFPRQVTLARSFLKLGALARMGLYTILGKSNIRKIYAKAFKLV